MDISHIENAAKQIDGMAIRTPLLRNQVLDEVTGARVFIKPECLQRTGSFKFRGAYNAISQLNEAQRATGIVASSSGNHAQGVAEVGQIFGCKTTIVMPSDAPSLKIERTKARGADVVFYDRETDDREECVAEVVKQRGGIFIHPFENEMVIAGQGTTGLEAAKDMQALGMVPDLMMVCTGGGGLTAGMTIAMQHHFPEIKVHPVEPEGFDDYRRSLQVGEIVANEKTAGSICDAILTPAPGERSFSICKSLLSEGLVVSDEDAMNAMRFAFQELKLVVEPGGAAALAALLRGGKTWQGETILIVISGGNVDPDMFARIVSQS